ncbi:acetolactate synthase small subunit [Buchnera aphidicola]|uniref:acetolactate synthase small subunit n=1 Tax=Buchnera aphidicola TaxID=9 RepID=UPI003464D3F5
MMRKILSILLENESGALSRVIGLFSQRNYNIESVTVAPTDNPTISKMTIQTIGEEKVIEQIEKQLHKLIDVLSVIKIDKKTHIEIETMLVKVQKNQKNQSEIYRITNIFQGKIVNMTTCTYVIQLSESSEKIDIFINLIKEISKILEIVRSGIIGITKN